MDKRKPVPALCAFWRGVLPLRRCVAACACIARRAARCAPARPVLPPCRDVPPPLSAARAPPVACDPPLRVPCRVLGRGRRGAVASAALPLAWPFGCGYLTLAGVVALAAARTHRQPAARPALTPAALHCAGARTGRPKAAAERAAGERERRHGSQGCAPAAVGGERRL